LKKTYTDIELVKHCKKDNAHYQKALVMQYSEYLFAICVRYMGEEEKAKDVLQDSLIVFFKSIRNFDPAKGSLKNYLGKICINASLKHLSKSRRFEDIDSSPNLVSEDTDALDNLKASDLFEMIMHLKEPYRTVFNLYEIEGFSHKEIADMLDIKTASSRSILSRAKELLRNEINNIKNQEAWT